MITKKINFVVAAFEESEPLIEFYNLKLLKIAEHYKIFSKDNINLIRTGVGNKRSFLGSYLLNKLIPEKHLWINFGTAGHKYHKIGKILSVKKVINFHSKKEYNVPIIFSEENENIITQNFIEKIFETDCLYDMECSGFCLANIMNHNEFSCLKIISDNIEHNDLNIYQRQRLIEDNMENINHLIEKHG
jgi:hypothetical protein